MFVTENRDASEQQTLSDKCGSYLTWSMYRPEATGRHSGAMPPPIWLCPENFILSI